MKRFSFALSPLGLAGLVSSFLFFTTCEPKSTTYEPTYSVDTSQKRTLLYGVPTQAYYDMHAPFVNYLNEHLQDIHIQLVASSDFSEYIDKLNEGVFDLAIANGV